MIAEHRGGTLTQLARGAHDIEDNFLFDVRERLPLLELFLKMPCHGVLVWLRIIEATFRIAGAKEKF